MEQEGIVIFFSQKRILLIFDYIYNTLSCIANNVHQTTTLHSHALTNMTFEKLRINTTWDHK